MCAPGTIEAVRERFEEDDSFVRIDRRKALVAGAGAAVAAAFPAMANAAPARAAAGRAQDHTHVFAESQPLFADIFPRPTRDTFVTVPNDGFYGQVWRFWEHTGTHLDVPAHFIVNGRTTPELTLDELMSPLAVVDISRRAASNPDTVVTVIDLRDYERGHGRIKHGSIVAMNSGWDARAGSEAAYRNTDASGVSHFPGFSGDAVAWLIEEREIAGIGVDTLSLDPGNATQFVAHLTLLGANLFGMENLANLGRIPAKGATAFVGVIPWEEGSGGPARVIATW